MYDGHYYSPIVRQRLTNVVWTKAPDSVTVAHWVLQITYISRSGCVDELGHSRCSQTVLQDLQVVFSLWSLHLQTLYHKNIPEVCTVQLNISRRCS